MTMTRTRLARLLKSLDAAQVIEHRISDPSVPLTVENVTKRFVNVRVDKIEVWITEELKSK